MKTKAVLSIVFFMCFGAFAQTGILPDHHSLYDSNYMDFIKIYEKKITKYKTHKDKERIRSDVSYLKLLKKQIKESIKTFKFAGGNLPSSSRAHKIMHRLKTKGPTPPPGGWTFADIMMEGRNEPVEDFNVFYVPMFIKLDGLIEEYQELLK